MARRLSSLGNPSELPSVTRAGIDRRPGSRDRVPNHRTIDPRNRIAEIVVIDMRNMTPKTVKPKTMDTGTAPVLMDTVLEGHGSGSHEHSSSSGSKQERRSPVRNFHSHFPLRQPEIQPNKVDSLRRLCFQTNLQKYSRGLPRSR